MRLVSALLAAFVFRLGFGLCAPLFTEDETQIFLLGLRYHATHAWPFFGPDVVWTESQIPGALQALLVGLPFDVLPVPEAPYLLLTLLSTSALAMFAWYLCERLPSLPRWLVWGWLMTLPWTLELSTHIINPSYVLPASLVFFLAWLEAWPPLTTRRLPATLCHALMGAALAWIAQVHMSWPLLLPFVVLAFLARLREGLRPALMAALGFTAGLLATGALVLPTWIAFGLAGGSGGTGANLDPHWRNPITSFLTTLARMLAFASYEVNRFIATGSARQIVFLQQHGWIVPVALVLWLIGLLHPLWLALTAFRHRSAPPGWPAVRGLLLGTAALVTVSFFFSAAPAQARSFYLVAPVAFLYAAYAWTFVDSPRARHGRHDPRSERLLSGITGRDPARRALALHEPGACRRGPRAAPPGPVRASASVRPRRHTRDAGLVGRRRRRAWAPRDRGRRGDSGLPRPHGLVGRHSQSV